MMMLIYCPLRFDMCAQFGMYSKMLLFSTYFHLAVCDKNESKCMQRLPAMLNPGGHCKQCWLTDATDKTAT